MTSPPPNDNLAILEVAEAENPVTVRGLFYRVMSLGLVPKTERGYYVVQRQTLKLRRAGVLPYGWITDGTRAGTRSLTQFAPRYPFPVPVPLGTLPHLPGAELGSRTLFLADDWSHGSELWVTDGTAAGTSEISVAGVGSEGLFGLPPALPYFAASPDGRVLFNGIDAKGDFNLWVTNGTSAGTSEISLAKQDPGGLNPQFLTVFGSNVLFEGVDKNHDGNLWVTNPPHGGACFVLRLPVAMQPAVAASSTT
jgi:ELWxxDGT repeat protein